MPNTNADLMQQLNAFTRREHQPDEVYLFDLILCDNEIDRDGDCFSDAALDTLCKLFVGVTGIFDHNPKSGNQTARIFRTEVVEEPNRRTKTGAVYRCLKANAYMIRTAANADLIREIDGGIKKEVSISCAVGQQTCSICGANRLQKPCTHIKGRSYGGSVCYAVLDSINDAYEWSFVAIPAQRRAGVTKTMGGASPDAETAALRQSLAQMTQTLDAVTEELRKDVVRLCYQQGETACAKALADSTIHMDADALLDLRKSLRQGSAVYANSPAAYQAQLANPQSDGGTASPYRMQSGTGDAV